MARSLRRSLILILLALLLAAWLVLLVVTILLAQQVVVKQVDRQLTQYMELSHHTLGQIFQNEGIKRYYTENAPALSHHAGITRVRGFGTQGREQALNLWFDRSQVVIGEMAPEFPQPTEEGFITWSYAGGDGPRYWRILYRHDPQLGLWLGVGVDLNHAGDLGKVALLRATLPLLVILPLIVLILLWGVRRGLRPLEQLAAKIEARQPQTLEPIDTDDVPLEIRPVVVALNGLLDRLQRALASETRFTANAAHELQTPLAAIKAEVQRYQRGVADPDSRQMLERISARVGRAANTVSQLLTLARLDPAQEFQRQRVELGRLVMDALADEGGALLDRKLDLRVPDLPAGAVRGHAGWLGILVRNLLSNAVRHTPAGGVVEVSLEELPTRCTLRIANDCASIPADQWRCLTQRFYTLPGNEGSGVGLGLSIVERIVELHGAQLRLAPWRDSRGFMAEVSFPSGSG